MTYIEEIDALEDAIPLQGCRVAHRLSHHTDRQG
jgi:hypothetical protein